jgi:hypothetical protein
MGTIVILIVYLLTNLSRPVFERGHRIFRGNSEAGRSGREIR